MKTRIFLLLLLLSISIVGTACTAATPEEESGYALYYLTDLMSSAGKDAIGEEYSEIDLPENAESAAWVLMERYVEGPEDSALKSPLPTGLRLQNLSLNGNHAYVDVSTSYGALSGIDLTLADYCIALTLTQLPEVSVVSITVNGRTLEYRELQNLRARDVMLSSPKDIVTTVYAKLWFLHEETGLLAEEEREILVYEGETRVDNVLEALLTGPESEGLRSVFPKGYSILSTQLDAEICYINLSSQQLELFHDGEEVLALRAAVQTLRSVTGIQIVQFIVDGSLVEYYGDALVGQPYRLAEDLPIME